MPHLLHRPAGWLRGELIRLGYPRRLIDFVDDVPENITALDLRQALERFFTVTVSFGPEVAGVRFLGDMRVFGQLRDFAKARRWLTDTETQYVKAFYALLSAPIHDRPTVIDPLAAHSSLRYIMSIIVLRVGSAITHESARRNTSHREDLVMQFLNGLRTAPHRGDGFAVGFEVESMKTARSELRPSDVPLLLQLVRDDSVPSGIRNRAASLILSPRCFESGREQAAVVTELVALYEQHCRNWPWEVPRGIALALSNRLNADDCLRDYLYHISRDAALIEANLEQTERYYGSTETAITRYLERLGNSEIPAGGCVWEAFYLARRTQGDERSHVLTILRRRLKDIESPALAEYWRATITHMERSAGSPTLV